jgi:hypothetical protein
MAIDKEKFRLKAVDRIKVGREHCEKWHREARDDYAFVAGDQWSDEDMAILREQNRPTVVFNYSEKMIDAVCGAEVSNRQEATYKPRGVAADGFTELLNNAARWVRDECLAEDEETDAFRDCLISGMGWTETKMDYTENKDGMPIIDRVDPTEMIWDPASTKPGLADRRWDAHGMWMDDDLIRLRWPTRLINGGDEGSPHGDIWHIQEGNRYNASVNGDSEGSDEDDKRVDQTMVWDYQCVEMEYYYRVDDGSGKIQELSVQDFGKLKDRIDAFGLKYVKLWKKVYYRAFLADDELLEFAVSPVQETFMRQCITGKRDRNRNMWYCLTRVMKDPQRWGNKWLSQIMHIVNSNAKGGLMIETGAAADPKNVQSEWAKPDGVVLLNEGGLNKIKEKTMSAYPNGLAQLMEFALNALPQVTGINLEALGLANRDQANVLEQSRKQAAYGLLAPIFDSLKRYRKVQGKLLLFFIREFISDSRLIRVGGPGSEKFAPLVKAPDSLEFDVIVDAAPTAPDVKQATWNSLMQIIPVMMKEGIPIPPDLLKYAPLPTQLIGEWQQFIEQSKQQSLPPQVQQQMQQMQEEIQKLQQENQKVKMDQTAKVIEAQTKQKEVMEKMDLERWVAQQEVELQRVRVEAETVMADREQQHKMSLASHQSEGNLKIKAASAGLNPNQQKDITMKLDTGMGDIGQVMAEITKDFSDAVKQIVSVINEPKQVVRGPDGKITGVMPVARLT